MRFSPNRSNPWYLDEWGGGGRLSTESVDAEWELADEQQAGAESAEQTGSGWYAVPYQHEEDIEDDGYGEPHVNRWAMCVYRRIPDTPAAP